MTSGQRICDPHEVDPFYMSPTPTLLERLAILNASFSAYFVLKVGLSEPIIFMYEHRAWLGESLSWVWWVLDWTPQRFTLFITCLFLSLWFNFLPSDPAVAFRSAATALFPSFRPIKYWVGRFIAVLFVLPSANLPFSVGGSYLWQFFLLVQFTASVTPNLWPWWFKIYRYPGLIVYFFGPGADYTRVNPWMWLALLFVPALFLTLLWSRMFHPLTGRRSVLPFHSANPATMRHPASRYDPPQPDGTGPIGPGGPTGPTVIQRPGLTPAALAHNARVEAQDTVNREAVVNTDEMNFISRLHRSLFSRSPIQLPPDDASSDDRDSMYGDEPIEERLTTQPADAVPFVEAPKKIRTVTLGDTMRGQRHPLASSSSESIVTGPRSLLLDPASVSSYAPSESSTDDHSSLLLDPDPAPAPLVPPFVEPPQAPQAAQPPTWAPGQDDFAPYRIFPSAFDKSHEFVNAIRSFPAPAPRARAQLDTARMCVWDCLATTIGADPIVLWAIWCAHQAPVDRTPFMDGTVAFQELPRIFTFFRTGTTLWRGTHDPRTGHTIVEDGAQAAFVTTASPDWPESSVMLTERNGEHHLAIGLPNIVPKSGHPIMDENPVIGYATRIVPFFEIEAIMNIPLGFQRAYDYFTGAAANAAAQASARFGFPVAGPQPLPGFTPLPRVGVVPEVIQYRVTAQDREYAKHLATDLKQNASELKLPYGDPRTCAMTLDSAAEYAPANDVELVLLNGAQGTGKSFTFTQLIRQYTAAPGFHVNHIRIHSWYNSLRARLMRAFAPILPGASSYNFPSHTRPLFEACTGTLFLDDAGLLWPGFIPLVILCNPGLKRVVCSFDSAQGRPPFPIADAITRSDISTVEWLSNISTNYATDQRRLSLENSDLFGLPMPLPAPGYGVTHGAVYVVSKAPPGVPYFAASPRFTETKNRGGQPAIAFTDAQGMSFDGDIAIDIGGLTDAMTDNIIWPVLGRGRNNIFLVVSPSLPAPRLLTEPSYGCSRILSAILAVSARSQTALITTAADPDRIIARAVHSHLARSLSPAATLQLGLAPPAPTVAGIGPPRSAQHDATLLAHSSAWTAPIHTVATARSIERPMPVPTPSSNFGIQPVVRMERETHRHAQVRHLLRHDFPVTNDMDLNHLPPTDVIPPPIDPVVPPDPADLHFDLPSAQSRELSVPSEATTSFQIIEGSSETVLKHSRKDVATVRASEMKRLRIGHQHDNLTGRDRVRLKQLCNGFKRFFPGGGQAFNSALFDMALRETLRSWAGGKTVREIQRSMAESPVDWDPHFTRLFLKAQTVKKLGVARGPAKPGQIIATFPKSRLFQDAIWARYMEIHLERAKRPSVYIHNKPATVMRQWYAKYWNQGACTASDYTAWDSGCDHVFAHFDAWLLRRYGIPPQYVDGYMDRKFNLRCYLGPLLPMQFSGDRWTYLFNTMRNAALTGATFDVRDDTPAGFSGDDMILCGEYTFRKGFRARDWLMHPKIERGDHLDFCGFSFGWSTPFVSSQVLLHRATAALQAGRSDASYWDSFDLAARFADPDGPTSALASSLAISATARRLFRLPPSKFPNRFDCDYY
jgi:hypothetical protein